MNTKSAKPSRWRWRALTLLFGGLVGLGLFSFHYAEGGSYLSKDPAACANCHIMQSQYDSWQKSSHHTAATCADCHLPDTFPENYIAKALNGWNHSKGFTLQDFPEPIRITEPNAKILQDNCIRCHAELTHGISTGSSLDGEAVRCTHCHRSAGHGPQAGLGGPFRDDELPKENR